MVIKATIENFTENELKCKCGCGSFNIDNEFLIRLQAFRYLLKQGMTPTSCCRCEKHNKAVGGVDTSLHRCYPKPTCAIDFYCQDLQKAYDVARNTNLFNEVIWYKNKGFIHLGLDRNQKGNYYMVK